MNRSKKIFQKISLLALTGTLLLLSACERVIDIKLNDVNKKFVVEGFLSTEANSCNIKISKTVNFSDPNVFPAIENATVTIQENDNTPVLLNFNKENGSYQNPVIMGTVGHTYTLKVIVDGETFTAISKIPVKVELDSIYIKNVTVFGVNEKYVHLAYTDPKGRGNSYRYIQTINGKVSKQNYSSNDEYTDGRPIRDFLRSRDDNEDETIKEKLKPGDIVKVELQCIDENIYKYWDSIESNQNTAPSNPVSNIKGGALGYFSAHTSQIKTITVK
ncbi:MAG: DUF4249 domain-containing protein [Sphingobacteriaceae bacterium]|nr:DUF4249 domain-containing protein [Sphingobacteriaceae bacterium]